MRLIRQLILRCVMLYGNLSVIRLDWKKETYLRIKRMPKIFGKKFCLHCRGIAFFAQTVQAQMTMRLHKIQCRLQ